MSDPKHDGLPVAGYKPQSTEAVELVNANKVVEEIVLRNLDDLAEMPGVDKRWLAIGRTQIEQGFMAVNRSIFKPGRVQLSDEVP
ncbi:MAG: cyclic nucleotide-binding protein [Tabrizicola sp.]|nr:cyclic nucleotide-binding protein [Tabrizicola sp.]